MGRRDARKHAFILIYQIPFRACDDVVQAAEYYLSGIDRVNKQDREFIVAELTGVNDNLETIDELISQHTRGWTIDRLASIDLAILRLSIYELAHMPEIPTSVSINEAVELCKEFGDDGSPAYVNGVLGKIAPILRGDGA